MVSSSQQVPKKRKRRAKAAFRLSATTFMFHRGRRVLRVLNQLRKIGRRAVVTPNRTAGCVAGGFVTGPVAKWVTREVRPLNRSRVAIPTRGGGRHASEGCPSTNGRGAPTALSFCSRNRPPPLTAHPPPSTDNVPVPSYFAYSVVLVYVGLLADIFVGAYLDVNYRRDPQLELMATVFQACAFLVSVMCLYNLLGETNLVKRGLFTKLLNEFAPVVVFGSAYFLWILVVRGYRLVSVFASVPHLEIWTRDGYTALYVINKICSVLYYASAVFAVQKVCVSPELVATRSSYFTPNPVHETAPRRYEGSRRRTQSSRFDL
jgi:hypothetical protein